MSSIPYIYPLDTSNYLDPTPISFSIDGGGTTALSSSIGPSLCLTQGGGDIVWHIITSNGVDTGATQAWVGNTNGGFFQMGGLCTLYVATAGNYNFNVWHIDGTIFAIQGAAIVSGPANNNPANQQSTPIAGYSFTTGGVAAANNINLSGGGLTDSYVINFPVGGVLYPMEWGWCSQNAEADTGHIVFLTGSSGMVNVPPGPGATSGVVYLVGSVRAWIIEASVSGTYDPSIQSGLGLIYGGIPLYCDWPIKKTPLFNTLTRTPSTGRGELRIPLMQFPLWNYELDISYLPGDATGVFNQLGIYNIGNNWPYSPWQVLINFLQYIQGAGVDWLFFDPFHNTVTNQEIAIGNGTSTEFSMIWTLVTDGAQELVQNFVSPPSIYVNGVLQTITVDYTIDTFGTLSFVTAPPNTYPITWSGQFFYRAHFLDDFWQDLSENWYQQWTMKLKFRSVLL